MYNFVHARMHTTMRLQSQTFKAGILYLMETFKFLEYLHLI